MPDSNGDDDVIPPDLLNLLTGTGQPTTPDPDGQARASALQTLTAIGALPQLPPAAAPAATVPPLGLMNPSDDAEHVIPPALMRPGEADETSAAREAQAGQPVLPPGLPAHVASRGPIPTALLRPEDNTSTTLIATRPESVAPPTPLVQDPQAFAAAYQHVIANAKDPAHPTDAEMASALEAANSATASIPKQSRAPLQPVPDLPLEQADLQDMQARARAQQSQIEAQHAAGQAATERALHLSQIDATESRDMERTEGAFRVMRETAERKAADETHRWMTKIDDIVRKEPDPGRMFHSEGGGMQRAMWFAAIVGQAIANRAHPERANVALQMLMRTVDDDVQLQKDQQAKQLQVANLQHRSAQTDAARATADLRDDRSQQLTRILTIGRMLRDKAMLPGPADQRAANLAASAALDQEAAKLAAGYHKEALETRTKDLDRQKDYALAGIREKAAMDRTRYEQGQQNYRQKQQQDFEVGPEKEAYAAREEVRKAALAKQAATDKAGAEMRAKQAPLNTDLGVTAIDPQTRKPVPLVLNDQDRQKAGEIAHQGNQEWAALSRLDHLMSGISDSDFVAGSPKVRAAMAEAEALRAKVLHGGGRISESFLKLGKAAETGMGDGWKDNTVTLVRGQLDEVRATIKDRLRELPQDISDEIKPFTRNNEEVKWSPTELQGYEAPVPDATDVKSAYGVTKAEDIERPLNVKEFTEVEQGKRRAPPLSPTGDQAVKDAVKAFGYSGDVKAGRFLPDEIEALAKAAEDRIRKEGHGSAYDADKAPIPETERDDVIHMVRLAKERALNEANEHLHDTLKYINTRPGHQTDIYNFEAFAEDAQKVGGFNIDDPATKASLRREYDKLHKSDGNPDYDKIEELLKATEERFK